MRSNLYTWILLSTTLTLSLICSASAHAINQKQKTKRDQYTFSTSDRQCKDSTGRKGYNQGTLSPCSDFRSMTLKKGKMKNTLQRPDLKLMASTMEGAQLDGVHFQSSD